MRKRLCCWCDEPAVTVLVADDGWRDAACAAHDAEYRDGYAGSDAMLFARLCRPETVK